jgi:Domain of unknown function (DUF4277)
MAVSVQQIQPVAHWPLVLGVLQRLEVATVIDHLLPPHPAHVLSTGRGVEGLVLAILDGDHALDKVGPRLEERGMLDLLQPELTRASLHDYRLGHSLDALFAANLNKVFRRFLEKILPYGTRPDYTLAFLTSNPFVRCSGVHTCPTPAIASVPLARTESRYPLSCLENDGSHTARL